MAMNEWKKNCVGLQRTWVSKRTVRGILQPSQTLGMKRHKGGSNNDNFVSSSRYSYYIIRNIATFQETSQIFSTLPGKRNGIYSMFRRKWKWMGHPAWRARQVPCLIGKLFWLRWISLLMFWLLHQGILLQTRQMTSLPAPARLCPFHLSL